MSDDTIYVEGVPTGDAPAASPSEDASSEGRMGVVILHDEHASEGAPLNRSGVAAGISSGVVSTAGMWRDRASLLGSVAAKNISLWYGRNAGFKEISLKIVDSNRGNVNISGYKIEVLASGSNGFVRLYEKGTKDTTGLDKTISAEDVVGGWGKFLEIVVDGEEGKSRTPSVASNLAGRVAGATVSIWDKIGAVLGGGEEGEG